MKPRRETTTMTYEEVMELIIKIFLDSFFDSDRKDKVVMEVKDLKEIIAVLKTQHDLIEVMKNNSWLVENGVI